jgi:hypothetical protein
MSGSRSFRPNPMKPLWVSAPWCRAIRRNVCAQPAHFVGRLCWPVEEATALVGGWRRLAPEERLTEGDLNEIISSSEQSKKQMANGA